MNKAGRFARLLLLLIMLLPLLPGFPLARATNLITLPFGTSWGLNEFTGTVTCTQQGCPVYPQVLTASNDFSGFSGSGCSATPQLRQIQVVNYASQPYALTPFPYEYGFSLGKNSSSYDMGAFGCFNAPNSYAQLIAFDSYYGDKLTPFRIENHTDLSVWYFHSPTAASKYMMFDAQLYNQVTGQSVLLGDFVWYGQYVVDQYGYRLNAAFRGNDVTGSWQHAIFNLDPVYNTSPGNWFVMRVLVRWDNSQTGNPGIQGQAVTFFDDVRWTTTVAIAKKYVPDPSNSLQGTLFYETEVEAWSQTQNRYALSNVDLTFKVFNTGYSKATYSWNQLGTILTDTVYPALFWVTSPSAVYFNNSSSIGFISPTGANLTSASTTHANEYVDDIEGHLAVEAANLGVEGLGTVLALAADVVQLSVGSTGGSYFQWPIVDHAKMQFSSTTAKENDAQGEVFMTTASNTGIDPGTGFTGYLTAYTRIAHDDNNGAVSTVYDDSVTVPVSWSGTPHPPSYPSQPYNPNAAPTGSTITLSWSPPLGTGGLTITNYKIYRGAAGATPSLYQTVGSVTSYIDSSVTMGTQYSYYLIAVASNGSQSPPSQTVGTVAGGGGGCRIACPFKPAP